MNMKLLNSVIGAAVLVLTISAQAETVQEAIGYLQTEWAIDNYQLTGKAQKESFKTLIEQANQKITAYPDTAELYIWRGIIKSTYAGVKGGLGALRYAKSAKVDLEKALELDPIALQGSAYTSLGTLYFNVPGWPVGFGDDDKAANHLKKALIINPDGIDPNYFFGDYLLNERRYEEAKSYMNKALQAKPRPGRALADEGRRKEIQQALVDIEIHLE